MESARDKYTSEIIEAEDLWLLDVVDTNSYVCWGCGIEMYPSAWQKGSKKRPSFNKMPGKEHINCDADAESTVVKQGQKKSVRRMLDSAPGYLHLFCTTMPYRKKPWCKKIPNQLKYQTNTE
ncbi:hypothetical protein [Klebsiella quasipneumoniae]|uniref:hypothetical protein n=1 Tax=Klebsiella quasipneumoniae TaxID=1463165 RepID=UPI001CC2601F|nr:hypothetical protein [Klebsiella quasipneumoniae]